MPAISLPNTISNGEPLDATEVQANFDAIATWVNAEAIRADGGVSMASPLTLPATNPTADNHAARKAYVDGKFPVGSTAIADGAVTGPKIADGAVTTNKIGTAVINGDKIFPGAITATKLNADCNVPSALRRGCALSSPSNASPPVWSTEEDDSGGYHATNAATVTIPAGQGGLYAVSAWFKFTTNDTLAAMILQVNGSNRIFTDTSGGDVGAIVTMSATIPLADGDVVRFTKQGSSTIDSGGWQIYRIGV